MLVGNCKPISFCPSSFIEGITFPHLYKIYTANNAIAGLLNLFEQIAVYTTNYIASLHLIPILVVRLAGVSLDMVCRVDLQALLIAVSHLPRSARSSSSDHATDGVDTYAMWTLASPDNMHKITMSLKTRRDETSGRTRCNAKSKVAANSPLSRSSIGGPNDNRT
jgi:hypothetical protein